MNYLDQVHAQAVIDAQRADQRSDPSPRRRRVWLRMLIPLPLVSVLS